MTTQPYGAPRYRGGDAADELTALDRRITDALAAVRRARAAVEHSPNSSSLSGADLAERTLDALLDHRCRLVLRRPDRALAGVSAPRSASPGGESRRLRPGDRDRGATA